MIELSFEARVEKRLDDIERQLVEMRTEQTAKLEAIEQMLVEMRTGRRLSPGPQPGDVLTLEEAARHLGVAAYTLRRGKAGTDVIPRFSDRPVQFLRSSLDRFKRDRAERAAAKLRRGAKRSGLIRRKPRGKGAE